MQKIRWFFLIVAIALCLTMTLQNNELTPIKLLWLESAFPLSVLMLISTAIGFLFGALMTASMLRSRKAAKKAAESKSSATKPPEPTPERPPAARSPLG